MFLSEKGIMSGRQLGPGCKPVNTRTYGIHCLVIGPQQNRCCVGVEGGAKAGRSDYLEGFAIRVFITAREYVFRVFDVEVLWK